MNNNIDVRCTGSLVAKALMLGALLLGASPSFTRESDDRFYPPDQTGPYSIGHTTLVLTDASRNLDGSIPVTSAGRFLYLHVWYPTTVKTTQHVAYT